MEHETLLSLTRMCGSFVSAMVFLSVSVCWWDQDHNTADSGTDYSAFRNHGNYWFVWYGLATVSRDCYFLCKVLRQKIHTSTVTIDLHEDAATTAPWWLDDERETRPE